MSPRGTRWPDYPPTDAVRGFGRCDYLENLSIKTDADQCARYAVISRTSKLPGPISVTRERARGAKRPSRHFEQTIRRSARGASLSLVQSRSHGMLFWVHYAASKLIGLTTRVINTHINHTQEKDRARDMRKGCQWLGVSQCFFLGTTVSSAIDIWIVVNESQFGRKVTINACCVLTMLYVF